MVGIVAEFIAACAFTIYITLPTLAEVRKVYIIQRYYELECPHNVYIYRFFLKVRWLDAIQW